MSTLPAVLTRLADLLRFQGVQLGASPLSEVASILSFLCAAGIDPNDNTVTAAITAMLLPNDDARRFVKEFDVPPELVPELIRSPFGIGDQLFRIVTGRCRSQAVVAASLFFASYHNAALRSDTKETHRLRSWLDLITQSATNADLGSLLTSELQKIALQPSDVVSTPGCLLFSISIDLVGSTDAKTRVMGIAQGDAQHIDYFNTQIYKRFCKIEEDFYRSCTNKYGAAKPINLKKFFAVKGIGDEIWILCDALPDEVEVIGERLIDSALQIAVESVNFFATEHDDAGGFNPSFDYGTMAPVHSPIQIFLDTIAHASDLGTIRDDHLLRIIPSILEGYHATPPSAAEIAEVSNRLCLGRLEACAWSGLQVHRTDYIGHEIDRFFRSTKAALPGTVTVGDEMACQLGLNFSGPDDGILEVRKRDNAVLRGGQPFDPIHCRCLPLSSEKMKGIGYPYKTYVMFAPRALNARYTTSSQQKQQGMPTPNYEETEKFLTPEAVKSAAELYIPNKDDDPR